ncbi:Sarcosine oxidase, gamma subunit family [Caballeronia arvi]|uniref:Sarcosine oxidase, gamma subunit family n=1 Tax=Caballeronia arvi TaxID=1777135 RepID=A0A158KI47_9BURK|nr:sarcosine oxidase subunit gamma family protein [Caballeronia arvi]SAL80724.1 Sarcosine oxidase, gamma subunit family [Caballeronia arvi]
MNLKPDTALGFAFGGAAAVHGFDPEFVTLTERSDIGCVLVNCAFDVKDVASSVGSALGLALPSDAVVATGKGNIFALWLTPRSWLIHCPVAEEFAIITRINATFPDKRVHASAFTDYLTWLEIAGKDAHKILTSGGFVSLEIDGLQIGQAKRTILASVPVVVVRNAKDRWTLGVERSRTAYFVDFLRQSAKQERGVSLQAS